ncbi:MAG: STAS domain-containing protein [Candidatus Solibacter sp.]
MAQKTALPAIIGKREEEILKQWLELQMAENKSLPAGGRQQLERDARDFMHALVAGLSRGSLDLSGAEWAPAQEIIEALSASRARDGFSPSETAAFVFSLKQPLFQALFHEFSNDADGLRDAVWQSTQLLDKLGLSTVEAYQKTREGVILRQQEELLELSTPVVRLWDNVLALPLIGTLDSSRTQVVMQNLLDAIVETRSDFAIIDITGVPVVDTLVAQHLLKTVAAARLMGADCLISGVRPQIAQTIIHLGVDLSNVTTKATLADAFAVALRRSGAMVTKIDKRHASSRAEAL